MMIHPQRLFLPLVALAVLAACDATNDVAEPLVSSVPFRQGGVEYTADTRIMESFPVQLDTRVTMRNLSGEPVTLQLGSGCPVHLRAFSTDERAAPAWDQAQGRMCTQQIQIVELDPGERAERSTRTDAAEILGDSLPDGRYWLSAFVQVLPEGVTVPAGEADLAVPR